MRAIGDRRRWRRVYYRRCGLLFGLLALAVMGWTLFAGETAGLSNNGDFGRVMGAASLTYGARYPSHTFADTFVIRLEGTGLGKNLLRVLFSPEGLRTYPSVHVAAVRLSAAVNLVLNRLLGRDMSTYRLEVLGAMYALAYAGGIGFLLSQFRLRWPWLDALVKGAFVAVLCDIGYTAYFNSFYGEAPEHIALIWCAGMLVRVLTKGPGRWDGLWCAFWAVMYGWAKFFNIPLAMLWLAVLEGAVLLRSGRRSALAWGGAGLAVLALVWTAVPGWMDTATNYNAVFYGVVRDTDRAQAEEYLADMGLPTALADWRDTNYYIEGVPESLEARGLLQAAQSVGKGQLLRFYATHPGRLWEQARLTALHCGMIRPYYLANLGEGHPLMTYSEKASLWSAVRDRLALDSLGGCLAVTAAALAMGWSLGRRKSPWAAAGLLAALLGGLCYAFLMPVIMNGEGDLAKHTFAYGEMTDLLLLGVLALGLDRPRRRKGRWVRPAILGALAAALILPGLVDAAEELIRDGRSHEALEPGAYLTMGSYEGRPLVWLAAERTEDGFLLLCADEDISRPFDGAGSNAWEESDLRRWLNGPFLEGFDGAERALLVTGADPVILPDRYRPLAKTWEQTFACSHIASLADRHWERAFLADVTDTVRLAGIDLAASLARAGRSIAGRSWWLETPYCPSEGLVRYVGPDGHIYFGDATAPRTVRPVVEIRTPAVLAGSGSRRDPFVLDVGT